jgi:hypothetical protein
MKNPRNWFVYFFGSFLVCGLITGVIFLYAAYAANEATPTRPLIMISETIPDNTGIAGQPLVVFARASDPEGIAQVDLWVNGQQVASQTNPDQASLLPFETSQAWIPSGAGNYLIVLKAVDRSGFLGESDPLLIQVHERGFGPDPQIEGEYVVQAGDTLESIAALFGTTPDDLLARNPGLGELTPGITLFIAPRPAGETGGSAAAPSDSGTEVIPSVDPPLPAPPAGGETEAEPLPEPLWVFLPLPDNFACLMNPDLCARAIDLEPPPFPAPGGAGFASGDGCGLDVSWTDNSENEDGFRIYRFVSRPRFRLDLLEIVGPGTGSGTRLHYLDSNPPRGSFFYAIVAFNAGGDTWGGPSDTVESEGCPPSGPILGQALVVEALEMTVTGSYDRLYCYASLADSPFERIPHGTSSFINLESGSWNIAEHFSGANKREVMASAVDPLNIAVECMGWQGEELINLGRFTRSHPPEEWDGRSLVPRPDGRDFSVTYRINFSFHAADEGGRAAWPLIDPSLSAPFNLHTAEDTSDCRLPPDRREPGDPCQRIELEWDYTPSGEALRLPTAYKVYRRSPGGSVPILYHTTPTLRMNAPLATEDCHETVFYSVSAVVGNDPVTGEEIQSPLSEEIEVLPTCASLEITLESLWVYSVDDGDPCTVLDDCHNDFESYGWFDFNGRHIRWNDHCDPGLFGACTYVGPSYSVVGEATRHFFSNAMLNTGDGWRRNNNIIRIPIGDGQGLSLIFTLMDHSDIYADENWCGATGRPAIAVAGRTASEWQTFDQVFEADDGNCIISFRVLGVP